jgi:hypothetical protein
MFLVAWVWALPGVSRVVSDACQREGGDLVNLFLPEPQLWHWSGEASIFQSFQPLTTISPLFYSETHPYTPCA